MPKKRESFKTEIELQQAVLREKARGTPDVEIGEKFGVSYKYIEKVITQVKGINVSNLNVKKRIKYLEPKNFKLETASVWSFRQRGDWATHSGEYRGNFSPYIPRNIILRYSRPGDLVLDMFCGAGTTAIEAKLLGRRCIAADINEKAIELAKQKVNFDINLLLFPDEGQKKYFEPELLVKDARDLSWLPDESVDLICSHPPYANIIQYTNNRELDLSFLDLDEFLTEMKKVAKESFRVLKPGRQCALLIGDTRKCKHVVPLGFKLINIYLEAGFYLRELIIKRQHNCKTTGFWYKKSVENNFLLLAHEYLPVFEKPAKIRGATKVKEQLSSLAVEKKRVPPGPELPTLETTTVWIFPEKERDRFLARNIVDRYAGDDQFLCLEISLGDKKTLKGAVSKLQDNYRLIWLKSSALSDDYLQVNQDDYLRLILEVINDLKNKIKSGGYLAIDTRDIRFNGQLIPLAKLIVDMIEDRELWLKEIVVVTTNGTFAESAEMANPAPDDYLKIVHSYVLVYERR
ncbi:MAG: methyltransferase domain-containing protein [Candidatus Aminicenantes bacterium]|nr:methyltransferase domain-containing protein [Candidatus Aminicenantes bacterium]